MAWDASRIRLERVRDRTSPHTVCAVDRIANPACIIGSGGIRKIPPEHSSVGMTHWEGLDRRFYETEKLVPEARGSGCEHSSAGGHRLHGVRGKEPAGVEITDYQIVEITPFLQLRILHFKQLSRRSGVEPTDVVLKITCG